MTEQPDPSPDTASAAQILVVDDNEDNRDMLSRRLTRRGYDVVLAEDGQQALDKIQDASFDLVLLDVMMPGMSGLEVLQAVRQTRDGTRLPIIMATAKDESADIVEALKLGANDYVTKPIDFPVLRARIETHLRLKRTTQQLEEAYDRIRDDLAAAADVQQALLPASLPQVEGYRFAWSYVPCDELAGDILNVIQLTEHQLAFYVLDVSGHGVQAALLSSALSHVLSLEGNVVRDGTGASEMERITPPEEVARRLSARFPMDAVTLQYFTMIYGILDLGTRTLRYICAGHPPPLRLPPGGEPVLLTGRGCPIGFDDDPHCEEQCIVLEPGDRLYLYTDGILEAMNANSEEFDQERFASALQGGRSKPLQESVEDTVQAVKAWTDGPPQDDITLLAVAVEE